MRGKIYFLIIANLLLASCTRKPQSSPDVLVFALADSPKTLDPRFALDANGQRIGGLLFNGLVKIAGDLKIEGDLAESWTFKNNVYKFVLRPGLIFSDGTPVTEEDIRFTFDHYRSERSPFRSTLSSIEKVDVRTEDGKIRVDLKVTQFSAPLLTDLTLIRVIPKKIVSELGDDFRTRLVGTGAFRFTSQSANEIVMDRVLNHPIYSPKVSRIVFKIIQDDSTRFFQMLKGNLDIVQTGIPLSKVRAFEKRPENFSVYKYVGPSMNYLLVNFKDPTVQKKEVREAISASINRDEIIQYKLEGFGQTATSILSPNNPFHHAGLPVPTFDPAKSKKLLGSSSVPLNFKVSNAQETVDVAKVLAAQLNQVGFDVKLQSYEWGTFFEDINKGNFQIAMMRWVGITDPDIYRVAFHSMELPPKRNRGSYVNKALDQLLVDGLHIQDEKARVLHYNKIQETIFNDLAIIPLWYNTQVAVVNRRVKNYTPSINGDFSPALVVEKE